MLIVTTYQTSLLEYKVFSFPSNILRPCSILDEIQRIASEDLFPQRLFS